MARLIVKSPYIKCGGGQSAGGYLKYIATRERVEIIPDDRPPTNKQTQLIAKLVKDFPDAKELMEYEDYSSHPTKATASALITLTLESNWDRLSSMEGYAKYIALRPRAERLGEHGLFGDDDDVDLSRVMDELDRYTGNVWTHIISLHREDAERLGYNHAEAWRTLLRTHRNDIAAAMKIPREDFRWYAAFHDEGNHPHVHMMAWSAKPNQAYLSKDGIRQIKSTLTNQIFRQELLHAYEQKSKSRDELVAEARKAMLELAKAMREMTCIHPEAEQMIWDLSRQLSQVSGRKTYGYLPKPMKKLVDEIVDQMARLPTVDACYQTWWELQCQVEDYYSEAEKRIRPPLSQQKEFRQIKNAVIREQDEQKLLIGPLARFDLLLDLIELSALAEGQDLPVGLDVVRLFDALEPEGKVHRGAPDQKLGNETVQAEPLEQRRGQDDRGGEQDGENDGVAVHGPDVGGVDFLFHGFQISFDELVERNIEEGAEQEQTVDIGIALARFP